MNRPAAVWWPPVAFAITQLVYNMMLREQTALRHLLACLDEDHGSRKGVKERLDVVELALASMEEKKVFQDEGTACMTAGAVLGRYAEGEIVVEPIELLGIVDAVTLPWVLEEED